MAVRDGRISPVLDVAKRLIVVERAGGREVGRSEHDIDAVDIIRKARAVGALRLDALICGAVSAPLEMILSAKGVQVVPLCWGRPDELLQAFLQNRLNDPALRMPGFRPGGRNRSRRRMPRHGSESESEGSNPDRATS